MKGKSENEVTQSCLTLSDPMDCSLPASSVHGIFQARILEWVAIAFSKSIHYSDAKKKKKKKDCAIWMHFMQQVKVQFGESHHIFISSNALTILDL